MSFMKLDLQHFTAYMVETDNGTRSFLLPHVGSRRVWDMRAMMTIRAKSLKPTAKVSHRPTRWCKDTSVGIRLQDIWIALTG